MREILFRGRTLNGKWIYGDRWINLDGIVNVQDRNSTLHPIVVERTIGQYTGLTDKNGVKIFEGDILSFTIFDHNDADTQHTGVVKFSDGCWELWKEKNFEYYGADGGFELARVHYQDDEIEIIGTIHDQQED